MVHYAENNIVAESDSHFILRIVFLNLLIILFCISALIILTLLSQDSANANTEEIQNYLFARYTEEQLRLMYGEPLTMEILLLSLNSNSDQPFQVSYDWNTFFLHTPDDVIDLTPFITTNPEIAEVLNSISINTALWHNESLYLLQKAREFRIIRIDTKNGEVTSSRDIAYKEINPNDIFLSPYEGTDEIIASQSHFKFLTTP